MAIEGENSKGFDQSTKQLTPFDVVNARVRSLWTPDATRVADLLGDNPMCIVRGVNGSGKSQYFAPEVLSILAEKGRDVKYINFEGRINPLRDLPNSRGKGDVLVLDEVSERLEIEPAIAQEVTSTSHSKGYAIIPLVAYPNSDKTEGEYTSTAWQQAEKAISGNTPPVYHLQRKQLESELAKAFLTAKDIGEDSVTPEDVATFIIQTVPAYTRLLNPLKGIQTLQEARKIVKENLIGWANAKVITPEEFEDIHQKLRAL